MTRKGKAQPLVDTDTFNQQDAKLEGDAGDQAIGVVKPCQNTWRLRVDVKAEVDTRKPKLEHARFVVTWGDGSTDRPGSLYPSSSTSACKVIMDHGARTATCRVSAKGWYLEAEKTVSIADGDNKVVKLVLKPAPWVALRVIDHKTGELIDRVGVAASLSVLGKRKATTTADQPIDIEHDTLRPDSTLTLTELSHDDVVWEVVGSVETA